MKLLLSIFSSNMQQFIRNIIIFILTALVGYTFLLCIWGELVPEAYRQNLIYERSNYGHSLSRFRDAKNTRYVQVLFLGSSHAYRGFDVRYLFQHKIFAFNMGSSAQTFVQSEMLLNRYLDRINPKMVVIETAPGILELDGVESTLDLFANDDIDSEALKLSLKINHPLVYNTMLYAIYKNAVRGNDSTREKKIKGIHTYRKNGYVEREVTYFRYLSYPPKEIYFRQENIAALKRIITKLKEKKIPYYLVQAPITSARYSSYSNLKEYESLIKPLGDYIDFNKILKLDDSLHFYDAYHLNQDGVERFNDALIDTLKLDERWN